MRMRTALLTAVFALSIGTLTADTAGIQPADSTHTENITFAPGGTVRINDASGYLSVEAWDQPSVEITVVKSMGFDPKPSERDAGLNSVKVVTEKRSDTEIAVTTSRTRIYNRFTHAVGFGRDPVVEYRLHVPRNSHVIVSHASGYVSVTGVAGSVEADNRRGDIVLMLPNLAAYSIDAHTKAGVVTSDLAGARPRKHLSGEAFTAGDAASGHQLRLRMGFGGITIKELPAESLAPAVVAAK